LSLKWLLLSAIVPLAGAAIAVQVGQTFALPGSVLLFGDYNDLRVVSPAWARQLRPPVDINFNRGYFAKPALAPRGDTIAWGFATEAAKDKELKLRFALGLYSVSDQKWTTHGDFDRIGDVAWSPTGTKVALIVKRQERFRFLIFDTVTHTFSEGPYRRGMSERSTLSWSADESHVVMEIYRSETQRVFIAVVNLTTVTCGRLATGFPHAGLRMASGLPITPAAGAWSCVRMARDRESAWRSRMAGSLPRVSCGEVQCGLPTASSFS
jgi:hypothetical protein